MVLRNEGTGAAALLSPRLSGDEAFALEASASPCGARLAPGASCEALVRFAPTATGAASATLEFAVSGVFGVSGVAGAPLVVALSGEAFNPVALAAAQLPRGYVAVPYAGFELSRLLWVEGEAAPELARASWALSAGALPAGLQLAGASLSGTPSKATPGEGADFEVTATYKGNAAARTFRLRVDAVRPLEAVQVSVGAAHACAVVPGGGVKCWGSNSNGRLGDGTQTDSATPVAVKGLASAARKVAAAAGGGYTCALLVDGRAQCWGRNDINGGGQLGTGDTLGRTSAGSPVVAAEAFTDILAGAWHACALGASGTVYCWGVNSSGQLGDGTTTTRLKPVVSNAGKKARALAVGEYHTCATDAAGALECWGLNAFGQLGNGTKANAASGVPVAGLSGGVTQVAAGTYTTCAVHQGAVKCWGWGQGAGADQPLPQPQAGLSGAPARLAVGNSHACALGAAGGLQCWGAASNGQLGNGATAGNSGPVAPVGMARSVTDFAAGFSGTCAIKDGIVQCWGSNASGQLGDGGKTNSAVPVEVRFGN